MIKKLFILIILILFAAEIPTEAKTKDPRVREMKHKYQVLKKDEKAKLDRKILNMTPSGYMTVAEYEELSKYEEKENLKFDIPKVQTPSDFKYVPKPLYRIIKYNDPPGSVELTLGRRLYHQKQINAQGIVSPDFSMLIYPAVYYYSDSVSVACDLFVIPLDAEDTNLNRILKANVAKRITTPILSTDKAIDNYASFRTLTPVDFSEDGTKLLVKEKIGSSEDGIWQTIAFVYDFNNKLSYNLSEVRDAIVYFWLEYMDLKLDDVRWDIYPIGFDKENPDRIIVQGYAFTGEKPVFLGTWSTDWKGDQSRLISFDKNIDPKISINGYKVVKDGYEDYDTVAREEKILKKTSEQMKKEHKTQEKQTIFDYKDEYNDALKNLKQDYKAEYRDYRKLRSLSGSTEGKQLEEAYNKYLIDQLNKDIAKDQKQIEKQKKELDKIEKKLDKLYNFTGDSSSKQNTQEETPISEQETSTED